MKWRASVITEFVEEAVEHIPGTVYMTLYPDPYPGHLYERAGIDLEAVEGVRRRVRRPAVRHGLRNDLLARDHREGVRERARDSV